MIYRQFESRDILACQRWFTILTLHYPAGSLPNLGVSHHLEVNGNSGTSKLPSQGWHSLIPVLPTFASTNCTPWYGEAVIYRDTAQHVYPPGIKPQPPAYKARAMTSYLLLIEHYVHNIEKLNGCIQYNSGMW